MSNLKAIMVSSSERKKYMEKLAGDLPVLRARIGISQEELCSVLGISRQTYSAVETGKRMMSWHTFITLLLYFSYHTKTKQMILDAGIMSGELDGMLNFSKR